MLYTKAECLRWIAQLTATYGPGDPIDLPARGKVTLVCLPGRLGAWRIARVKGGFTITAI